jgi:rhodanese-related sulfurtransferase
MLKVNRLLACLTLLLFLTAGMASAAPVPKITAEELNVIIDDPELIVIDVRLERDWKSSQLKIKGAVWEDFQEVNSWARKYPKDKTIVLYCD